MSKLRFGGPAAFVVMAIGAFAAPAAAAPISVNSTGDVTADDGSCTLREAVIAANEDSASGVMAGECAAGSGSDDIDVPSGPVDLATPGVDEEDAAMGDLDVTAPLTITGAGAAQTIVDANGLDRVFDLTSTLSISDLTVREGSHAGGVEVDGGAVLLRSAGADLTATETRFVNNTGSPSGGALMVKNATTAEIVDSTFTSNAAGNCSGAICVDPGGTLTVTGSTFSLNGIRVPGVSFSDHGGAIYSAGTTTVTNSTFTGNEVSGDGGAIVVPAGTTTISSSTIAGNTADANPDDSGDGGGINERGTGQATLVNTIVGDNAVGGTTMGPDCFGALTSNGHNLVENTSDCTGMGMTDLTGMDPALMALADNGGPTETRRLGSSSPAIDAGIGSPQCPGADQRGVVRPQGPSCDIGAFETTPPSSTFTFPLDMQTLNASSYNAGCGSAVPDLCGTASPNPNGSAVSEMAVRIRRMSDSSYWNGVTWQPGEFWNPASGTTMWSYGFTPGSDTYTISSRATDDDNYVETPVTRTFTVDLTVPAQPPVQPTQPAQTQPATPCRKGFKKKRGKCVKKKKKRKKRRR